VMAPGATAMDRLLLSRPPTPAHALAADGDLLELDVLCYRLVPLRARAPRRAPGGREEEEEEARGGRPIRRRPGARDGAVGAGADTVRGAAGEVGAGRRGRR
jgi:hypothetical protein